MKSLLFIIAIFFAQLSYADCWISGQSYPQYQPVMVSAVPVYVALIEQRLIYYPVYYTGYPIYLSYQYPIPINTNYYRNSPYIINKY